MDRWQRIRIGLGIGLLLVLAGCSSFNVRTDWDPDASLDDFDRYFFLEPAPRAEGTNPFADNDLLRKRVRESIERILAERGFRATSDRGEADFLVTYAVMLDDRLSINGYTTGSAGYHRRAGYGFGYSSASVRQYQESTLMLDLLDPETELLVWRGWGTGIVRTRDRDRGAARLDKGVRAILDRFPPD